MKFLQQLNQPLVYILLVASGVTAFLGEGWIRFGGRRGEHVIPE